MGSEQRGILQQIREEIQRAYQPGKASHAELPLAVHEAVELQSALQELNASYAEVGQIPPQPATLRAKISAPLVKLVQRLLFWYTPQIVRFQQSAARALEAVLQELEWQTNRSQELETELQRERSNRQEAVDAAIARTEIVARQLGSAERQWDSALERERVDRQVAVDAANARTEDLRLRALPRMDGEIARLRAQQTVLEERIARLIRTTAPAIPVEARHEESLHDTDALFAELADEFRGNREDIKERLAFYLPKLVETGIGSEAMPVLDVGCGRGEWLELLAENGLKAAGLDLNRVVLEICRERGLNVMEADAIDYLRGLPEGSLGGVTAFHLIEHLELPQLLDFLEAVRHALKPGGIAIFETPNPNNLLVSSRYFYLDPSHRHPIPPLLGKFLAEARGFERVEILELHPWPEEHHVDTRTGGEVAARFNECFYGPQDYAIIGWKG